MSELSHHCKDTPGVPCAIVHNAYLLRLLMVSVLHHRVMTSTLLDLQGALSELREAERVSQSTLADLISHTGTQYENTHAAKAVVFTLAGLHGASFDQASTVLVRKHY